MAIQKQSMTHRFSTPLFNFLVLFTWSYIIMIVKYDPNNEHYFNTISFFYLMIISLAMVFIGTLDWMWSHISAWEFRDVSLYRISSLCVFLFSLEFLSIRTWKIRIGVHLTLTQIHFQWSRYIYSDCFQIMSCPGVMWVTAFDI